MALKRVPLVIMLSAKIAFGWQCVHNKHLPFTFIPCSGLGSNMFKMKIAGVKHTIAWIEKIYIYIYKKINTHTHTHKVNAQTHKTVSWKTSGPKT